VLQLCQWPDECFAGIGGDCHLAHHGGNGADSAWNGGSLGSYSLQAPRYAIEVIPDQAPAVT
jgi:hypothetical protein